MYYRLIDPLLLENYNPPSVMKALAIPSPFLEARREGIVQLVLGRAGHCAGGVGSEARAIGKL